MSIWFVIPSKRPLAEAAACVHAWRDQGYCVALARELVDGQVPGVTFQQTVSGYQGWARSVNMLVAMVLAFDERAEWIVTGGDDYFPDLNKTADEIAEECLMHFNSGNHKWGGVRQGGSPDYPTEYIRLCETCGMEDTCEDQLPGCPSTFGVMQPTGDRWGERNGEATIDRIAGSPWMGREFCRRMYHGAGPLYNGYYHNFADEHLQRVAQKLGVFWQRRDLIQEHRHWARPRGDWRDAPEWAKKINDPKFSDWDHSKALFKKLESGGFREADDLLPE